MDTVINPAKKAYVDHDLTTDIDISSRAFWSKPFEERAESFARLRKEAPVSFHRPIEVAYEHEEKGFWAVTTAADITEVARMDDVFLSGLGNIADPLPFDPRIGAFFHTQDGEEQKNNRALVSTAFTPKNVARMIDQIHETAELIVDDLIGAGDIDFVAAVSEKLPSITGARLFGLPESEREAFGKASNSVVAQGDPEAGNPEDPLKSFVEAKAYFRALGLRLAAERREDPRDDLMTSLVQAELDGRRLTDEDIAGFTSLMAVGSNDTTKQTTTLTLMALAANPDQKDWLMADFDGRIGTATNEFLRNATPVIAHARTAARDITFRGQEISKGDKVAIFYTSGNRDEERFVDPMRFDLSRRPNPQISFGGGGVHYCLGNRLATAMLQALFGQLLRRTTVTITGEPEYLVSSIINGVRHLPVHIA
ncbi:cytochrome P450 [Arthrobacter sp. AZCC_0090]|uniref:cytochrome P450 n=1 Tax=Arthrobacter sp. AZCC_0090 TaxID=2735881 RepID=UPI001618EB26|nr:cytochrome P450 [Arthrobacter sp. AZCC_0090]MBB6407192.1 cytochrome P450 [Arthrobacter sp. AZCC_0090]